MNSSHTQPWEHFYRTGDTNLQVPPSSYSGDISVGSSGEFFQNMNTTVEQQWRDANDNDVARERSSMSRTVLPNHAAMYLMPRPVQGALYMNPQATVTFHGFPPPSDMIIISQQPYQSGLSLDYLRAVPRIYYGGFNLQNAVAKDFSGLQDSDQLAWADDIQLPSKLAIVLWFPGYPRYKHQATVLRAHRRPPTRGSLACVVAREMDRLLEKARTEYRRPLCWQGRELSLSDFFLIDIEQVSKGSLQPGVGIRGNTGLQGSELVHRMNAFLGPLPGIPSSNGAQ